MEAHIEKNEEIMEQSESLLGQKQKELNVSLDQIETLKTQVSKL